MTRASTACELCDERVTTTHRPYSTLCLDCRRASMDLDLLLNGDMADWYLPVILASMQELAADANAIRVLRRFIPLLRIDVAEALLGGRERCRDAIHDGPLTVEALLLPRQSSKLTAAHNRLRAV
jgi:hypothetical protein